MKQQIMDELKIINQEIKNFLDQNPVKQLENRKQIDLDAFSNSLSHLLELLLMTPSELSNESGINSCILMDWLKRKRHPNVASLLQLSRFLECTPEIFFNKDVSDRFCEILEKRTEELGRDLKNREFSFPRVKEICSEKGIRTTDFKNLTGFSFGVLKSWKTGTTSPRLSAIRLISDVLNVPPSAFMIKKSEDRTESKVSYEIYEIAYWFQRKAQKENSQFLEPNHIQILCFYAQAWRYTLRSEKLMDSEFEARINGPFSDKLFNKIGLVNLYVLMELNKSNEDKNTQHSILNEKLDQDEDISEFLELVWNTYKNLGAISLGVLVRTERPWVQAQAKSGPDSQNGEVISLASMKEYYFTIAEELIKELYRQKSMKGEKHGNQSINQTGSQKSIITEDQ